MRGDRVGVGDIGEVHGDARGAGDTAGGDDGGGAGRRERDAGVVGGRGGIERDASTEPGGDRVGVGDGARGEHGACDVHGTGSGGAHGMRGDGVGVGDISPMSYWDSVSSIAPCSTDCWLALWKHQSSGLRGFDEHEHRRKEQSYLVDLGIHDCAWREHGCSHAHD